MASVEEVAVFNRSVDIHRGVIIHHPFDFLGLKEVFTRVTPSMAACAHRGIAFGELWTFGGELLNRFPGNSRIALGHNADVSPNANRWRVPRDRVEQFDNNGCKSIGISSKGNNLGVLDILVGLIGFPDIIDHHIGSRIGFKSSTRHLVRFDHLIQLAAVNESNYYADSDGTTLKDNFPKWRWVGVAIGAFGLMCYGWWHLRNEIRIAWGFWCWFIGIALWIYTVNVWISHMGTK